MRLGDLLAGLGRPVAYYPSLVPVCGGVKACLVFCQLAYWHGKQHDPDGWITKGWVELEEETGLSRKEQRTARSDLRRARLIEERVTGVPPTAAFRLNFDRLEARFADSNWPVGANQMAPSGKLNGPQGPNIESETTAENTAENTCAPSQKLKNQEKKEQDPTTLKQAANSTSKDWALQIQLWKAVKTYAASTELPVDACRWLKRRRWEDEVEVRPARSRSRFSPDRIPDTKPARSPDAIASVRDILSKLPWVK